MEVRVRWAHVCFDRGGVSPNDRTLALRVVGSLVRSIDQDVSVLRMQKVCRLGLSGNCAAVCNEAASRDAKGGCRIEGVHARCFFGVHVQLRS